MEQHMISKLYYSQKYRINLVQLLGKFTNNLPKNTIKEMYNMIKNKSSDAEIVNYISSKSSPRQKAMLSTKRAIKNAKIWYSFLDSSNVDFKNTERYLDIGSNDGLITLEFGKKLGLTKENIYGIDIKSFTFQEIKPVENITFTYYDGCNIPFDDNYFDLITCSMVLHHVKCLDMLVSEISRVLERNGILLVKEHNADSTEMQWLIFLEHLFYDVLEYGVSYDDFFVTYYQKLFSKNELISLLQQYGLKIVKMSDEDINFTKKYQYFNPTNSYFAIFTKT